MIRGKVYISKREHLITISVKRQHSQKIAADTAVGFDFAIRGKLDPPPPLTGADRENVWVRLSAVHGVSTAATAISSGADTQNIDVPVDSNGEFKIRRPLYGRYLLLVIRGEQLLHMEQVFFEQAAAFQDFVIKLPRQAPPVLRIEAK